MSVFYKQPARLGLSCAWRGEERKANRHSNMQDTWDAVYTDTWEAVYIELGEPDDLTDMFFAALAASGYTGNERRFRHFFRALK